ncbi:hypothetical protein MPSI1_002296 [Malassezia psittaci]|uniref:Uncharacterized protein n=1 Tax=Malassezia psittaci TaxID=1821823 RepID=A0AAF0JEF0_9BASI|nr:hypothetical protein MPSI1_002296 [Malassezia psittaci]
MSSSSVRRRYALLLARDVAQSSLHDQPGFSEADTDSAPWWRTWTAEEKSCFLHAVAIHSRLRPDLIAEEVRSRSVEEVCYVLRNFRRSLRKIHRLELAMNRFHRRNALHLCLPAREMSNEWINLEEQIADTLASAEDQLVFADKSNQIEFLAEYLRQPQTDTLADIVTRLVVPTSPESPSSQLLPTETYRAFAHIHSVPAFPSYEQIASAVEALIDRGYLQCPNDIPRPIQTSTILQPIPIFWSDTHDTPLISREALIRWLQRHTHAGKVPYLKHDTIPTLTNELKAFLVHVINELITVQQRTLHSVQIEEQHVWAAVARLGYATPSMNLHQDLIHTIAIQRALADPPVAWMHHVPSEAYGGTIPIDNTLTNESDSSSTNVSEDASSSHSSSDLEGEVPEQEQDTNSANHQDAEPLGNEPCDSESGADSVTDTNSGSDADPTADPPDHHTQTNAAQPDDHSQWTHLPETPFHTGDHRRIGSLHPIVPFVYEQEPNVTPDTGSCSDSSSNSGMESEIMSTCSSTESGNDSEVDRLDQVADTPYQQELYEWLGLLPDSQNQDRE